MLVMTFIIHTYIHTYGVQKTFKACCLTHNIDTLHYAYLSAHTHTNRNNFNRNVSYARGMHPAYPYSESHLSNEKGASTYICTTV